MSSSYPRVILLLGNKSSGKDTVADYLVKEYGYKRIAFADKIRETVVNLYDLDLEMLKGLTESNRILRETPHKNLGYKTPRQALQLMGTEVAQSIYPQTWSSIVKRQVLNADKNERFAISDCRFEHEILDFEEINGSVVWGLKRKATDPKWWQFLPLIRRRLHKSERYIPDLQKKYAKAFLFNDGTIDSLKLTVDLILQSYD